MWGVLLVVLALGGLLCFLWANARYKKTNAYRNTLFFTDKFLTPIPQGLEIVNTGSSYSWYAFDYTMFPLKGFNFAIAPQTLYYDAQILRQYQGHLCKGAIVLIPLQLSSFWLDIYTTSARHAPYYFFLEPQRIAHYSAARRWISQYMPLLCHPWHIKKLFSDEPEKEWPPANQSLAQAREAAESRVAGWCAQFHIPTLADAFGTPALVQAMERTRRLIQEILQVCEENGFRPVFVVMPVSEALWEKIPPVVYDGLLENIRQANTAGTPVLNYMGDERLLPYTLYSNADFLTKAGSEKFMRIIWQDLAALGLL